MRRRPCGPTAWIVEDLADPIGWADGLAALGVAGVREIVPAETTVLVRSDRSSCTAVGEQLDFVVPKLRDDTPGDAVTIHVVYDGDDLGDVADRTGLAVEEVIERHEAGVYTVAFCGFSPGFGYLRGLDPALHLPRRATPRTNVPAGSVAVAAGYSCVYPSPSPGGWHLLGTTTATVWDAGRKDPALLRPGMTVRFRRVER